MPGITFIIIFNILISIAGSTYSDDIKISLLSKEYFSDRNVEIITAVSENKIQLARQWDVLLDQGFDEHGEDQKYPKDIGRTPIFRWEYTFPDGWKFINFKNALKAFLSNENDTHNAYLLISGPDKGGDTAFELNSPMIPVETGKSYTLTFRCQLSKKVIAQSGFNGTYETGIIWLASDNQIIDETPFSLLNEEDVYKDWYTRKIEVISPERATKAMLRFGFDLPNLGPGDFVCFDDIRFATLSTRYEPEGEFISRPLRVEPGKLFFLPKADMPTGTSIRFQLKFAEDNYGVPGTWTAFTGQDDTTLSYYDLKGAPLRFSVTPAHRWLQYRAVLHTIKPDTTPALHSVIINSANGTALTDSGWSGTDTKPPEIVWRSPTRTEQADAPISFRLCDNTGGIGVKNVEAYLDGEKVELLQGKSNENEYTLKTTGPLKPLERDTGLSAWKIENYQNALTMERSPEIITFINNSKSTSYVDTAFKMCSPKIPVIENTKYVLSFFSRHNSNIADIKHWGNISNGIIWRDLNGKEIGEPYRVSFGVAHMKWHRDVHKVKSPSGAVSAEICFGWDSPNLNNGEYFSIKDVCFEGPRSDVACEPNLHKIEVKACDLAGNTMQKTWYLLVKKSPVENIVTLRDDGMTLIDNKPFFPIGIYAVQKTKVNNYNFDNAFKELKDAGFNTVHTYMKERNNDFTEFYSTAARYGMKVFVMTSAGHNSTDIETVVHDVAAEVDQPALLSWYLADDTSGYISSKDLKNIHEIIKDIDPYHLTSQADAVGAENRYKGYGDSTDIFLPELYPIRKNGKNEVAEVSRDMHHVREELKSIVSPKGIWAIVQDFKGWGWKRYPTNEELRVMTYLSIIHGATGITYYTYGGWGNNFGAPYDKDVWRYLKKVVGELAYLHDVLAERRTAETCDANILKGAKEDGLGYPALNTLLKVHNGKHYLFSANSAKEKMQCQFKPATKNISEVFVMFEDRTLPVKDGVFVDDFKPYEVHVYQW
ncbi:MAG: hypothetical protein HKUEN01_05520 [Candidatus Kuenenia stuttgartiensis]|nr:MAG: hypothetical protein HKUEN01_05520 [Candidatus Kuenenia stuttgartiensis]